MNPQINYVNKQPYAFEGYEAMLDKQITKLKTVIKKLNTPMCTDCGEYTDDIEWRDKFALTLCDECNYNMANGRLDMIEREYELNDNFCF